MPLSGSQLSLKIIQMSIGAEIQNERLDFGEKYIRHLMDKVTWII